MSEKSMCVIAVVLLVALMVALTNATINDRYTTEAVVVEVDGQTISAEDTTGNVWCYTVDGDTVPRVGERVVLTLLAMGTDTIYDDKVVDVECA
jgi:hypothetical protein